MTTETLATIGAATGIVALILHAFNAWHSWSRDRVKVNLRCNLEQMGSFFGSNAAMALFTLRIENYGTSDVSVEDVGVDFGLEGAPKIEFGQTVTLGGDTETYALPLWLKSHQALSIRGSASNLEVEQHCPQRAYVKLGTGKVLRVKVKKVLRAKVKT